MAYDQQLADALRQLAEVKARDEMNWKTLRECADILCLPDESPSLLPEKIRLLQVVAASEKKAKVERGEEMVRLGVENAKLREAMESAHRSLHSCVKVRWDEAHVENAYFTLNAAL